MDAKSFFLRLCFVVTVLWLANAPLIAQTNPDNLIVNGSFETPLLPAGANHVVAASELLPWQTTEGAFLIWASVLTNELAAEGRQHAEIVTAWQTVPTIAGQDYSFRFHHSPRPGVDSTLSIGINGQVIRTFAENGAAMTGFNWRRYGTNFTATGNATTFRFNGMGVAGNAHIDNVVLELLPVSSVLRVSEVELCWESVATKVYQVEYRSVLTTNFWTDFSGPVQGNGATMCIKDAVPIGEPQKFYRMVAIP